MNACLILAFWIVIADDDPASRETLRGLTGVRLVVETNITTEGGLTIKPGIESSVETQFRRAGIKVLSGREYLLADSSVCLRVFDLGRTKN